jgi:hypothetical protein
MSSPVVISSRNADGICPLLVFHCPQQRKIAFKTALKINVGIFMLLLHLIWLTQTMLFFCEENLHFLLPFSGIYTCRYSHGPGGESVHCLFSELLLTQPCAAEGRNSFLNQTSIIKQQNKTTKQQNMEVLEQGSLSSSLFLTAERSLT